MLDDAEPLDLLRQRRTRQQHPSARSDTLLHPRSPGNRFIALAHSVARSAAATLGPSQLHGAVSIPPASMSVYSRY